MLRILSEKKGKALTQTGMPSNPVSNTDETEKLKAKLQDEVCCF